MITAPVGLKSVAEFFGVASDVAAVCTASMINKWAKYKPTGIDPTNPATPSSTADTVDGYWWGVHLESRSPTQIHSHSFDYDKPSTGFKRLAEFAGYMHAAEPNLDVECSRTPKSASGEGDTLNPKNYYDTFATFSAPVSANQFGVDYIAIFADLLGITASDPKAVFQYVYPVCIFDDWMCVMYYYPEISPYPSRTVPLSDGTAWYNFFALDLAALNEAITGGITDGEHNITLGVILKLADQTGIDFSSNPDYSGAWQEVKDTWYDRIFPMRSFTGKVFNVKAPVVVPTAQLSFNYAMSSVRALFFSVRFPSSTEDIPLQVRVTISCNYGSGIYTMTFDANPKDSYGPSFSVNWEEFGIIPAAGTRYTFTGTVQASADGTEWKSGTGATLTYVYYESE